MRTYGQLTKEDLFEIHAMKQAGKEQKLIALRDQIRVTDSITFHHTDWRIGPQRHVLQAESWLRPFAL